THAECEPRAGDQVVDQLCKQVAHIPRIFDHQAVSACSPMNALIFALSTGTMVRCCLRCNKSAYAGGRQGSTPSASCSVAANFAGSAVSMQIIGTSALRNSCATLTPSAVCGSIITQ